MKFLLLVSLVFASNFSIAQSQVRCLPGEYTPDYVRPYCVTTRIANCEAIGCELKRAVRKCVIGPYTPSYSRAFCPIARPENCEAIGCELIIVYQ